MTAGEIRSLARRAGIGPGDSVLDLCCGVAGPGRLVAAETGCRYLGVDLDPGAVAARPRRARAGGLPAGSRSARSPPLPSGSFDVVLLLETLLAFPDKEPLLAGGRSGAASRRPVRLHGGGGAAADGCGAGGDARFRHGVAGAR